MGGQWGGAEGEGGTWEWYEGASRRKHVFEAINLNCTPLLSATRACPRVPASLLAPSPFRRSHRGVGEVASKRPHETGVPLCSTCVTSPLCAGMNEILAPIYYVFAQEPGISEGQHQHTALLCRSSA